MSQSNVSVVVCPDCNLPEADCLCENPIDLAAEAARARAMRRFTEREYIGDGVYARCDRFGRVILTTEREENGRPIEHFIVFDPVVLASFEAFIDRKRKEVTAPGEEVRRG